MKATINEVEVEGTPHEIMEFKQLMEDKKELLVDMIDNPFFIGYKPYKYFETDKETTVVPNIPWITYI